MRFFLIIFIGVLHIQCSNKYIGYSYKINQYFSQKKGIKEPFGQGKNTFFSYKNYLFELVNESNFIQSADQQSNKTIDTSFVKIKCVYAFVKDSDMAYQLSAFSKKAKLQESFLSYKKELGLKVGQEDEMTRAAFTSFLKGAKKDTIVYGVNLLYKDTSFIFDKNTPITSYFYFKKEASLNTVFSFNKTSMLYKNEFLYYGLESVLDNKNYMGLVIEGVKPLSKEETDICEHLISLISKSKN